jgi:hypothetical protein
MSALGNGASPEATFSRISRPNRSIASGSNAAGRRAAAAYSPITTCELDDVDPRAWLADALDRPPDYPATRLDEPPPWNGKAARDAPAPMRDAAVAA